MAHQFTPDSRFPDRYGRRPVMLAGITGTMAMILMFGLSSSYLCVDRMISGSSFLHIGSFINSQNFISHYHTAWPLQHASCGARSTATSAWPRPIWLKVGYTEMVFCFVRPFFFCPVLPLGVLTSVPLFPTCSVRRQQPGQRLRCHWLVCWRRSLRRPRDGCLSGQPRAAVSGDVWTLCLLETVSLLLAQCNGCHGKCFV